MPPELIELEQARRLVLARAAALGPQQVDLQHVLGRTLAEDLVSAETVPGFDNSAMDGYAVGASDTAPASAASPVVFRAVDESSAGHPAASALKAGEAIAIATGAMLPSGADAVVAIEETVRDGGEVQVRAPVEPGHYVRRAGEDIHAGEVALPAGTVVGPFELGVVASVGAAKITCVSRPTLRVLTTGDELLAVREPLRPGGVRDTNAHTVPALAALAGAELLAVDHAGDAPAATRAAVEDALDCEVAVICGGVSVGVHDHVRPALQAAGAKELFWGVALRPGRPTWFGERRADDADRPTLVFGLPGNPVSAIVTFLLLVRPAIRSLCGADTARDRLTAVLDEDYPKQPGRAHAVRCRLTLGDDGWHARPTGPQGSHLLSSMVGADGLAIIPSASAGVRAGERVEVELLPTIG